MPMNPHKGEKQDAFMARCVPDLMGPNKDKRPQDQAVAACLSIWRKDKGEPEPSKSATQVSDIIRRWHKKFGADPSLAMIIKIADCPEPEDDETKQEYMDRCMDEVGDDGDTGDYSAEDACELTWEDEGEPYSGLMEDSGHKGLVHKTATTEEKGMEFILSDATPDRFGDIVDPKGWDFKSFTRNPIALFNHDPNFIVGSWKGLRVHDEALRGHLTLAPKGTSARIDEIRSLVEAGILKAVSVGFKPVESKPREDGRQPHQRGPFDMGGMIYTKSELVETSLVSIPANPNALAVAKSLRISKETQALVFREHAGKESGVVSKSGAQHRAEHGRERARAITAEHGKSKPAVRGQTIMLSQRIQDAEKTVVRMRDELNEHLATIDDANPDPGLVEVTEGLTTKLASAERNLAALKAAEARLANGGGTTSNGGDGDGNLPAVIERNKNAMMGATAFRQVNADRAIAERMVGTGPRPFGLAPKKVSPVDFLIRQGVVAAFSHATRKNPDEVRQLIYGNDDCTRAYIDYVAKAASAAAMTSVTGWAAELVQQVYGDFLQLLGPTTVMPALSAMGLTLTFGRAGKINIPSRSATPSIAGSFVGEGQPIPVRQAAFVTQALTPKKLGVITSWTREIDEHSLPAIEGVLRDSIAIDTGIAIDVVLLDTNAATTIRPAGIRSGVAGLTPTAGGGFNALIGDLTGLAGALLTATAGHIRSGVFLMNPQQAMSIGFMQPPNAAAPLFPLRDEIQAGRLAGFRVIISANVPLKTVIFLDAADFVSVGSESPRFEVSDQATLHYEDTNPSDITGGTPSPAVPVRSLWQTDSIALRLVWPLNWTLRRPGMVAWVAGVTW